MTAASQRVSSPLGERGERGPTRRASRETVDFQRSIVLAAGSIRVDILKVDTEQQVAIAEIEATIGGDL